MKNILIALTLSLVSTTAFAKDLHLNCSYVNLIGDTNVEHIVIGEGVAANMADIPNLGKDLDKSGDSYTFSIKTIVAETSYSISKDLSNFKMVSDLVIKGEKLSSNTFTGSCEVR